MKRATYVALRRNLRKRSTPNYAASAVVAAILEATAPLGQDVSERLVETSQDVNDFLGVIEESACDTVLSDWEMLPEADHKLVTT